MWRIRYNVIVGARRGFRKREAEMEILTWMAGAGIAVAYAAAWWADIAMPKVIAAGIYQNKGLEA
jgi:hypothetical protein